MLPDLRPSFYYTALVSVDMLSNPYDASPGPRDGTFIVWDLFRLTYALHFVTLTRVGLLS